jgi:hypothetical protein
MRYLRKNMVIHELNLWLHVEYTMNLGQTRLRLMDTWSRPRDTVQGRVCPLVVGCYLFYTVEAVAP